MPTPAPPRNPLPQALEPALVKVSREKFSGFLVATDGSVQKRIALEDGEIVFAASSDDKDLIGQALLRSGLISEGDLVEALSAATTPGGGPRLAAALTAMRKVTPEQCSAVFESKMREAVLDVFLWPSGSLQIVRSSLGKPDAPFPLKLSVPPLVAEGKKRRGRWLVTQQLLPDLGVAFERIGHWPKGFPGTNGDRILAALVDCGRTLGQILLELHGQEYAIKVRLATLVEKKVLATRVHRPPGSEIEVEIDLDAPLARPSAPAGLVAVIGGVSEVPKGEFTGSFTIPRTRNSPVAAERAETELLVEPLDAPGPIGSGLTYTLLEHARSLVEEKELERATIVLDELVQSDPLASPEIWELQQKVQAEILHRAEVHGFSDGAILTLAVPLRSLVGNTFSPAESFVVGRFAAAPTAIGAVKAICPFPPYELVSILERLMDLGVLRRA